MSEQDKREQVEQLLFDESIKGENKKKNITELSYEICAIFNDEALSQEVKE